MIGQRVRLRWVIAQTSRLAFTPSSCSPVTPPQRIKGILNQSRKAHTDAVQGRIGSVTEMKDVVNMTKQMFEISKVRLSRIGWLV
jgi:hypothetical protein